MATSSSPERGAGAMRTLLALPCVALALALAPAGRIAHAAESEDACTALIDTAPYGIDFPGTYCLTQNVSTNSIFLDGIYIDSDDVIVDCNGFRIDGTAAGTTGLVASGIHTQNHQNITVRNCHVRGYLVGINLEYTGAQPSLRHVVEDNRVELSRSTGIRLDGDGSVIRRNSVINTIAPQAAVVTRGISTDGNVDVIDNLVSGVQSSSADAAGIFTLQNEGGSIRGNRVRGVRKTGGPGGTDAIHVRNGSVRTVIRNNTLVGEGQAGSLGIYCEVASNRAKGNSILGFTIGVSGCSNDGNVVKP